MLLRTSAALALSGAALLATAAGPASAVIEPSAYEFSGQQLTLGTGGSGGPDLTPGLYRTSLPNDGSPRTFTVDRSRSRSFLASVLTYENQAGSFLLSQDHETEVRFSGADGQDCGNKTERLSQGEPAGIVVTNLAVDDDPDLNRAGYLSSACRESKTLTVTVTHTGAASTGTTQAEILLTAEPKGTGDTGTPATAAQTTMIKAPTGPPKPEVPAGKGFGTAATLTAGTYPMKLTVGARVFYKVRLDWGQRLAATMTVPAKDSNFAPPVALETTVSTWSPQRVFLDVQPKDFDYRREAAMSANNSEVKQVGSYTAAVRWANRSTTTSDAGEVGYGALPWTTVPGWYYVTVNVQPRTPVSPDTPLPDSAPEVPAELSIAVVGDAQPGPKLVDSAGRQVAAPAPGRLSVGSGAAVGTPFPWAKAGLSATAVLLAAAAVTWALRRTAD